VLTGQAPRAEREHLLLRGVDVVDPDVQV
jgi:hypothetical protein